MMICHDAMMGALSPSLMLSATVPAPGRLTVALCMGQWMNIIIECHQDHHDGLGLSEPLPGLPLSGDH